ncbi:MAG: hypothetical protein D6762_00320 [Candidatus Neomarinimicrobiota bacterium]|nr:MAG: hypothetical protein D6762_00320 [Candidatus Neomarinimicrobiota bacterium]
MRVVGILAAILFASCTLAPDLKPAAVVSFPTERIPEASGIVPALEQPGIFWLISDSGNPPELVAIDARGQVRGVCSLSGVINADWEALTRRPDGTLVIGDLGNNLHRRRDQRILVLEEPAPGQTVADPGGTYPLVWPADSPWSPRTPDVEALFSVGDSLWALTKQNDDETWLLRLEISGGVVHPLPVQSVTLPGLVTGADYSAERRQVAVLTYTGIYIYDWRRDPPHLADRPRRLRPIWFQQAEGICWDGNTLRVVNEQGRMKTWTVAPEK